MMKSMGALALTLALPLISSLTLSSAAMGETNLELATKAATILGVGRDGACSSCHAMSSEQTINRWATATQRVESCLAETNTSQQKLACMSQSTVTADFTLAPSQLGIYAAGVHLDPIKSLVNSTFTAATAKTILDNLVVDVGMPFNTDTKLTEAQFDTVRRWFAAGTPELSTLLAGEEVNTSTCQQSFTPALSAHLKASHIDNWETKIADIGTPMFGCTGGASKSGCFTQQRAGVDIFPEVAASTATKTWKRDPNSTMRILTSVANKRQYWVRSSADGRFVGFGGPVSGIIDLQSLLAATPTQRIISVNSLYDPGFFPDDSGFIWQSNTTGMCNMSILRNTATKTITFNEDACTTLSSKVPLYQTIGASLNGEDYLALTSSYQRDPGLATSLNEFIPGEELAAQSNNKLSLFELAFDGQSWVRKAGQTFNTPYEIDWILSHSNQLGMSRVQAERDGVVRTSGFNLHKFTKNAAGQYQKTQLASLCGEGLKGDFSFNERFYVTYSYIRADQWKYFGYASANDPAFVAKMKSGSADIYLYDLYTQKNYAITNMKANQYALYPHFRADGWLYFEVLDVTTGKRSIVASDAAITAERSVPFQ